MSAKCRSNHHIELSKVKFKRKELKIPFPFILITSPCLLIWLIYSYGLMFVSPLNSYVEILTPQAMIQGSGALGGD